jgi:hypothetical protein
MGKIGKRQGKTEKKKTKDVIKTKLLFMPEDDSAQKAQQDDGDEAGMLLEKDSVPLIYNALKEYKPTAEEGNLHSVLLEEFEEILVVDYGEPYPDAN